MSAPSVPSSTPAERVGRGALLALLVIPAGVGAWLLVWSFGYIASIVAAGVAFGAFWLYTRGAGGISRLGALVVLGITVVTLLLAFFSGIVLDAARGFGEGSGLGTWGAFTHEQFWPTFWDIVPPVLPDYGSDFAWALGFGALGSWATLRTAFAAAKGVPAAPAPEVPVDGVVPGSDPKGFAAAQTYEAPVPAAEAVEEPATEAASGTEEPSAR